MPRSVAMKLTGHKTESIYRRYAVIVAEQDLRDGVAKLAALHQKSHRVLPLLERLDIAAAPRV